MHNPSRRDFLKLTGAGALALGAANVPGSTNMPKRNILLYVVDDQGMNDAGCYGNPVIKTPGIDDLAAHGTRFTHGFCTTPSCSASRSVILTGMHNHANGQYGHSHGDAHFSTFDNIRSLPGYLSGAGYRTLSAGKYHVAPKSVYPFDRFENHEYSEYADPPHQADMCRDLIAADDDRPFFLYFCSVEPHRPFYRHLADPVDPADVIVPDYLPDIPECREELAQYYASVQQGDMGLVRLLEILRETGHWDDTLVVFISDNGIAFSGAKTCLYEPGMRLPCVVRDPFQEKQGVTTDAMITWSDLTPTLLDWAGVKPEDAGFHGRSFLSVLDGGKHEGWDEIYASHTFHEITMYYPMRVVRERRYKLIWNIAHGLEFPFASDLWDAETWKGFTAAQLPRYGKRPTEAYLKRAEFELYDLEEDPHEVHNLADDPAHADRLVAMKAKIRAFQESTRDPWVIKWIHE